MHSKSLNGISLRLQGLSHSSELIYPGSWLVKILIQHRVLSPFMHQIATDCTFAHLGKCLTGVTRDFGKHECDSAQPSLPTDKPLCSASCKEQISSIFTYRRGKCMIPQHGLNLVKDFLKNKLGHLILNIFET